MLAAPACLRVRKPLVSSPPLSLAVQPLLLILAGAISIRSIASRPSTRNGPPCASIPRRDRSADPSTARSNCIITHLSREGKMADARHLFDQTPERDVISWTAVISGYIRCGMIREARLLFDRPDAEKNVVTWTAMLSGYIRSNQIAEAEELFRRMPEKNVVTWNTMVGGYAENGLIDQAYDLFERMPFRNIVSWNTILTALSQSERVDRARELFDQMPKRDVISWTAMVAGLSQNGRVDEARDLFDRMPERNIVSWNAMISGYAQNLRLGEAHGLFEKMPERDIPSWNTMITGFIQNGDLARAKELFDQMHQRNVVTWTALISGYTQEGQNEVAFKIFSEMQSSGVRPNQGTFVSILTAVSNLAAPHEGLQIHQIIGKTVFQFSPLVESALMSMYSKCGEIGTARKLFDLSNHKDLVSWNGMIAAYAHHGYGREALRLFEEMRRKGFDPDEVTYIGLLSACSHSGLVDEGLELFRSLVGDGSVEVREDHYACLVDLCGRAGRLVEAAGFIKGLMNKPSSACVWGALLSGCNVHGDVRVGKLAAKKLLEVEPNNAGTYMLLSNMYASAGRWSEAARIRLEMKDRGLKKQPGCSWIEVGNRFHVFVARDKSHSQFRLIDSLIRDLHHKMRMAGYAPTIALTYNGDELMVNGHS